MTSRFVVVYEAPADLQTATELADRVILETIYWIDDWTLQYYRTWVDSMEPYGPFTWTSMKAVAKKLGIRIHGHFDNEPASHDAQAGRRAIAAVLKLGLEPIAAILLIRDSDDDGARRGGLEQAREDARTRYSPPVPTLIGLAITKRECWALAGFIPNGEPEENLVGVERQNLGFDPCLSSHELTAANWIDKRSAKRVLALLTGGDHDRERRCWRETGLETLRDRGRHNGLADYIQEVEQRLVPLISGHDPHGSSRI